MGNLIELKPKLTIEDQIQKLKEMGIFFNIVSEEEAKSILSKNTYFFKLAYYRKNFHKYDDGYRIEFAVLSDLANIDMRFRYTLLHMTLDIEHSIKCLLMKLISEDKNEDGYSIILDFLSIDKSRKGSTVKPQPLTLDETIKTNKENLFKHLKHNGKYPDEIKKYIEHPPVWFCVEIMQLGQFTSFLEFYYKRSQNKLLRIPSQLMRLIKNIRNKCAHNQALLMNLSYNERISSPRVLMSATSKFKISIGMFRVQPFIDILATFYMHSKLCSDGIKTSRLKSIKELNERYNRNISYYNKYPDLQKFFKAIDKIIINYS